MLHASETVTASDARPVLAAYLSEWRQLAATYGGDAKLIDEEFVGAVGVTGTLVPRPDSYFDRFYEARDAFIPYIAAMCKLRVDGACVTASGNLRRAGAWPEPEADGKTLLDDLMALDAFIELGTAPAPMPPSALVSTKRSRGPAIAAIAAGLIGTGLLVVGLAKAGRR
jgi:hypothetical protein